MKKRTRDKKGIIIDPDLMGLAAGIFFGTIVMALGFWQDVNGFEVAFRTGATFLVSYACVFLLTRYILHIALALMIEQKAQEEAELKRAEEAAATAEMAEMAEKAHETTERATGASQ